MDYENIKFEKDENIAIVTINRPKVLNALNDKTIGEISDCFAMIKSDKEILCVILTGEGEKSFVAGADIGELAQCDIVGGRATCDKGQSAFSQIENLPQPVIAAINGFALGGGCELAMACDIRLASNKAKIGQPEVNLGLIPGYGGTQRLPRLVGLGKAMQMILTGDFVNADEAYRIGLVDEIFSGEELLDKAKEMAKKIASKGPLAVKASKEAINLGLNTDIRTGCEHEATLFGAICGSEDKDEGTGAFLEKRKPAFKGK